MKRNMRDKNMNKDRAKYSIVQNVALQERRKSHLDDIMIRGCSFVLDSSYNISVIDHMDKLKADIPVTFIAVRIVGWAVCNLNFAEFDTFTTSQILHCLG